MKKGDLAFGKIILEARRKKGLRLKDCAPLIFKEDNTPISVQYLSDIESGRRNPPSEFIVKQLSQLLTVPIEVLYFYAGVFPKIRNKNLDQKQIIAAYKDFTKALNQKVTV